MTRIDLEDASLIDEKLATVAGILDEVDIDCWLLWVPETSQMADPALSLLLEADLVWPSALLYTRTGERIAVVGAHDRAAIPPRRFHRIVPYTEGASSALRSELARIAPGTIAVNEAETMSPPTG